MYLHIIDTVVITDSGNREVNQITNPNKNKQTNNFFTLTCEQTTINYVVLYDPEGKSLIHTY